MINIDVFYSGSSGNMYLVSNEDTQILLECGIDKEKIVKTLWKEKRTNLSKLNGCLISHPHKDHMESIEYINQYLPIYANEGVYNKYSFKGFILAHNTNFEIGSIKIKPIEVNHGKTPNLAFIFKDKDSTIFFGTDFSYIESNLSNFKFNQIFIEINYINNILNKYIEEMNDTPHKEKFIRQINTHMSLENVISNVLDFWNLSECKEIIAIHMSLDCGDRELIKTAIQEKYNIPCYVARKDGGY